MTKLIWGILLIVGGIVGGFLAKDGWKELSAKPDNNENAITTDSKDNLNMGLPDFEDAPIDNRSFEQIQNLIEKESSSLMDLPADHPRRDRYFNQTKLQKGGRSVIDLLVEDLNLIGRRFTWSIKVTEIMEKEVSGINYVIVDAAVMADKHKLFFIADKYQQILRSINRGEEITVTGIMNKDANLMNCRLIDNNALKK